jgi:hypothetical protein
MNADEGVPQNLAISRSTDEGVARNLVEAVPLGAE